jgi:hypothetical protein
MRLYVIALDAVLGLAAAGVFVVILVEWMSQ